MKHVNVNGCFGTLPSLQMYSCDKAVPTLFTFSQQSWEKKMENVLHTCICKYDTKQVTYLLARQRINHWSQQSLCGYSLFVT